MMGSWSQLLSISIHIGIAGLAFMYQPHLIQMPQGDGLIVELQDGPTPQGVSPIPVVEEVKPKEVTPIEKTVSTPTPTPTQQAQPQPESAPVITQTQESPIEAAPEMSETTGGDNLETEAVAETPLPEKTFGVNEGIQDARLLKQKKGNRPPAYPVYDRFHKRQGRVTVLGFIDDSGKVRKTKLESSTGSREMNKEALNAFSLYRFEKGQRGWVRMPFDFVLNGPTEKLNGVRDRTDRKIQ